MSQNGLCVFCVIGEGEAVAGFCCCCCQILKQTKKDFFGSVSELLGHHGSVCVVESKGARFSGDKKGQARYLLHRAPLSVCISPLVGSLWTHLPISPPTWVSILLSSNQDQPEQAPLSACLSTWTDSQELSHELNSGCKKSIIVDHSPFEDTLRANDRVPGSRRCQMPFFPQLQNCRSCMIGPSEGIRARGARITGG